MRILYKDLDYFSDPFRLDGEGSFSWRAANGAEETLIEFEARENVALEIEKLVQAFGLEKVESTQLEFAFPNAETLADQSKELCSESADVMKKSQQQDEGIVEPAEAPEAYAVTASTPKKRGRKPKAAAPVEAPVLAPAVVAEPAVSVETQAPPAPAAYLNFDTIRETLKKLTTAKGIEAARELLGKFGAERISALKEEHYSEFVKSCDSILNQAA
jgi:hypothetical protein